MLSGIIIIALPETFIIKINGNPNKSKDCGRKQTKDYKIANIYQCHLYHREIDLSCNKLRYLGTVNFKLLNFLIVIDHCSKSFLLEITATRVACLTVYVYIEQYHVMVKQIIGVTDIYKYIFLS